MELNHRYVIRVYKMKYSFENYDDIIYRYPEEMQNRKDMLVERYAKNINDLIKKWHSLLTKYEGYTYCVKDTYTSQLITGGVYDPDDVEYINEYFNAN